jgi:lambda family phage portal protein
MGLELNQWNRVTRYAVLSVHPGDRELRNPNAGQKHVFVPASDMIHCWGLEERVGQLRCEPLLTPVIIAARNMNEYAKSHLLKKRCQANALGFIVSPDSFEGELIDNQRTVESEPGQFRRLNPGESAIPPDFGAEDTVYPQVIADSLRTIAVGTGTTYSTISGDFSGGSYASLRISVFENRDSWKMLQSSIINQFCQRIFEEWIYASVMSGALPSPVFDDYFFRPDRYTNPKWQARSWSLLDSNKDIQALSDARKLQLETHDEQISHYTGEDFADTIDKIASENEYKRSKGLLSELDDPQMALEAKRPAAPARPEPSDDEEEDQDD